MGHYQILPDLTPEQFQSIKESIAAKGVQVPVVYDDKGNIMDGHHRVQACQELGIEDWPRDAREGLTEDEKWELVLQLNMHRRQLSRAEKQHVALILSEPPRQWSQRKIAACLAVAQSTVSGWLTAVENIKSDTFATVCPEPTPQKKPKRARKREAIESELIADRTATSKEIARRAGAHRHTVAKVRREMASPPLDAPAKAVLTHTDNGRKDDAMLQEQAEQERADQAYAFVERFWTNVYDFMGELRNRGRAETVDAWIADTLENHRREHITMFTDLLDNLSELVQSRLEEASQ